VRRNADGEPELDLARFWFIPPGFQGAFSALPSTFNARAETVFDKPTFRRAARVSRCLVPATGWREFQSRQPYHFVPTSPSHLASPTLFAFAGLSSTWQAPDGSQVRSFAILTTEPTPPAKAIHNRMPLVLPVHLFDEWLSESDGRQTLAAAEAEAQSLTLNIFPTDPAANSTKYEGPLAVQPCRAEDMHPGKAPKSGSRRERPKAVSAALGSEQLGLFGEPAALGSKDKLC
jgi:putative SOS response-associated peptidase YedK